MSRRRDRARALEPGDVARESRGVREIFGAAETNASRRAGTRAIADLGSYPSQEVGELVWVRRGELADLPRRLVPRSGRRARLEQAEKPVEPAAPAIVSHDCARGTDETKREKQTLFLFEEKNEPFQSEPSFLRARGLEDRPAHGHAHGRYRRACPSPACGRPDGRCGRTRTRRRSRAQPAIASHAGRVLRVFVGPAATRPVGDPPRSLDERRADVGRARARGAREERRVAHDPRQGAPRGGGHRAQAGQRRCGDATEVGAGGVDSRDGGAPQARARAGGARARGRRRRRGTTRDARPRARGGERGVPLRGCQARVVASARPRDGSTPRNVGGSFAGRTGR